MKYKPVEIKFFSQWKNGPSIKSIAADLLSTVFILQNGQVFVCGRPFGVTPGIPALCKYPMLKSDLDELDVESACVTTDSWFFITTDSRVFAQGRNNHGIFGVGDEDIHHHLVEITEGFPEPIVKIDATFEESAFFLSKLGNIYATGKVFIGKGFEKEDCFMALNPIRIPFPLKVDDISQAAFLSRKKLFSPVFCNLLQDQGVIDGEKVGENLSFLKYDQYKVQTRRPILRIPNYQTAAESLVFVLHPKKQFSMFRINEGQEEDLMSEIFRIYELTEMDSELYRKFKDLQIVDVFAKPAGSGFCCISNFGKIYEMSDVSVFGDYNEEEICDSVELFCEGLKISKRPAAIVKEEKEARLSFLQKRLNSCSCFLLGWRFSEEKI